MKIAIKGHPTRGKEVIKILESLGGKNIQELYGNREDYAFYYNIDSCGIITLSPKHDLHNYKFYTLEEFDKEFPFKIGDKVSIVGIGHSIIALEYFNNKLCYKLDNGFHYSSNTIKSFNEMKEERNVTLTLDKAKEWYKKGGELREIALQAFTEKELTKVELPKTWEEFCINYPIKKGECWINSCDSINICNCNQNTRIYKNWTPSRKSAEAHLAMIQLEQLRDCWRQGWVQTPTDAGYRINKTLTDDYAVMSIGYCKYFLAFPTRKMAEDFLECFRDLIEKAGDLI